MPRVALDCIDYLLKLGRMLTCARHGLEIIIYICIYQHTISCPTNDLLYTHQIGKSEEVKLTQTHLVPPLVPPNTYLGMFQPNDD